MDNEGVKDLLAMKPPSPPTASEIPFTICSIILGIPAMKLIKAAMRSQHSLSIALLIVENMTSKTEAMRSLNEVMTDSMINRNRLREISKI